MQLIFLGIFKAVEEEDEACDNALRLRTEVPKSPEGNENADYARTGHVSTDRTELQ